MRIFCSFRLISQTKPGKISNKQWTKDSHISNQKSDVCGFFGQKIIKYLCKVASSFFWHCDKTSISQQESALKSQKIMWNLIFISWKETWCTNIQVFLAVFSSICLKLKCLCHPQEGKKFKIFFRQIKADFFFSGPAACC